MGAAVGAKCGVDRMGSPLWLGEHEVMNHSHRANDIAEGAQQLWRAAAEFEQSASRGDPSAALPEALDYLKESLELLATGVAKASQAIEELAQQPGTGSDLLSPRARALRWHLSHLSARLLGARDVGPETRRWALELLQELDRDEAVLEASANGAVRPAVR
jgi:hypothetical protein